MNQENTLLPIGQPIGFLCPWCRQETVWLPLSDHSEEEFDCLKEFDDNWNRHFACLAWIVDGKVKTDVKKYKTLKLGKVISNELGKLRDDLIGPNYR